ncbi:MAG: hypothetical protein AAGJ82_06555, partial [Bacteroidota bacterium]
MILTILTVIGTLVGIYLAWGVIYQLLYAFAGCFWKSRTWGKAATTRRIAVFVPGYREDAVIVNTAQLRQAARFEAWMQDVCDVGGPAEAMDSSDFDPRL